MQKCASVHISMNIFIKLCKTIEDDTLTDQKEYVSIVRDLMFVACVTRLDIIYAAEQLSQFLNNPSSKHLIEAKRVSYYLKEILTLSIIYHLSSMRLTSYSDAN